MPELRRKSGQRSSLDQARYFNFDGVQHMNTLQRLFDRLVGIALCEEALHHKAHQVYCTPSLDLSLLERPACWRRAARIQARRR